MTQKDHLAVRIYVIDFQEISQGTAFLLHKIGWPLTPHFLSAKWSLRVIWTSLYGCFFSSILFLFEPFLLSGVKCNKPLCVICRPPVGWDCHVDGSVEDAQNAWAQGSEDYWFRGSVRDQPGRSQFHQVHQQSQGDLQAGEVAGLPANWKLARGGC